MSTILRVTYAATDGTMPESVEIEWTDEVPEAGLVHLLVKMLVGAPSGRVAGIGQDVVDGIKGFEERS